MTRLVHGRTGFVQPQTCVRTGMVASLASVIRNTVFVVLLGFCCVILPYSNALAQSDPLPSWNGGAVKTSISDFVARVTTQGGADFVPPAERIAVFDND